ncbi:MAG: hypothetical protein IT328_02105 [Caldilineaceae bacterium]|nr:hypothetical protein [Caldilineaceae bacterium]
MKHWMRVAIGSSLVSFFCSFSIPTFASPVPTDASSPAVTAQDPIQVSDGIQMTRYVVNMFGEPFDFSQLSTLAQRFYASFEDEYDFLIFMPEAAIEGEAYGRYYSVRNDVTGIGKSIFDLTADYGSAGRLKGSIFLNRYGENGPTMHEIMHTWGVAGNPLQELGFTQCTDRSHWGVAGVGNGQLGGFDPATLVNNGDGSFTVDYFGGVANGGDSVPYVPLELYLAGYIEANEVPPIQIPTNVDCSSLQPDPADDTKMTFRADGLDSVTIEEIQALLGVRSPGPATSQKDFSAAMIVVSEEALSSADLAFYEQWAQVAMGEEDSYILSFAEATGGRGQLNMLIGSTLAPFSHSLHLPSLEK